MVWAAKESVVHDVVHDKKKMCAMIYMRSKKVVCSDVCNQKIVNKTVPNQKKLCVTIRIGKNVVCNNVCNQKGLCMNCYE